MSAILTNCSHLSSPQFIFYFKKSGQVLSFSTKRTIQKTARAKGKVFPSNHNEYIFSIMSRSAAVAVRYLGGRRRRSFRSFFFFLASVPAPLKWNRKHWAYCWLAMQTLKLNHITLHRAKIKPLSELIRKHKLSPSPRSRQQFTVEYSH